MGCAVEGCCADVYAAGLCSPHYARKRTKGTTDPGPRAHGSAEERFRRYVAAGAEDECWEWQGKSKIKGYGVIGMGGRRGPKILAHRFAYTLANGPIPEDGPGYHGYVVMHTCDNRLCCNPAHLVLGTQTENVADMNRKNRGVTPALKGSKHPNSRFTEEDVRYMRRSPKSNVELAKEFGCARQVIGNIRRRISWKHVD